MRARTIQGLIGLVVLVSIAGWGGPASSAEPAAERTPELAAWESLHYGMFIHFGMSTFTGREIDKGDRPSTAYAPTNLDVDQWIRVARDAGMKYAVLTAKHVAGHCLWDSKVRWKGREYDYDIATSGDRTDVVAAFMAACKKYGVKPGIYYCVLDGHNEDRVKWGASVGPEYFQLIKDHLTELHTRYPGIYEQWIDIPSKLSPDQRQQLYDLVKRLSPECFVMMNAGFRDGVEIDARAWPSDLIDGERTVPPAPRHNPVKQFGGKKRYVPMEVCETIGENWFFVPNDPPKPTRGLYVLYRNTVDRGANLLLDVPPDKSGRIPESHVEALRKLKQAIDNPASSPGATAPGKTAR